MAKGLAVPPRHFCNITASSTKTRAPKRENTTSQVSGETDLKSFALIEKCLVEIEGIGKRYGRRYMQGE